MNLGDRSHGLRRFEKEGSAERIKRRLALAKTFYPLGRTAERRWARLFKSEFPEGAARLGELAAENKCRQTVIDGDHIIWRNSKGSGVEGLFYFVPDAADLKSVIRLFKLIEKLRPFCTHAIVHQKKDCENCYDIFRLTPFSYLEHCNRVRSPLKGN